MSFLERDVKTDWRRKRNQFQCSGICLGLNFSLVLPSFLPDVLLTTRYGQENGMTVSLNIFMAKLLKLWLIHRYIYMYITTQTGVKGLESNLVYFKKWNHSSHIQNLSSCTVNFIFVWTIKFHTDSLKGEKERHLDSFNFYWFNEFSLMFWFRNPLIYLSINGATSKITSFHC